MNLLKVKTEIRRWLNRKFKFEHFSSAPYLSGDTFRSICNHAYDEFSTVYAPEVQRNDIVFVRNSFVKEFFSKIHPNIRNPYILLTHNDDTTIDESFTAFVDEKIIHWFGVNINIDHPKMTPLPIGLENINYRRNGLLKFFSNSPSSPLKAKTDITDKKPRILVAFHTNKVHPERLTAFNEATKHPLADIQSKLDTEREEYIKLVTTYSHILSPRGAGIDCHRTWEALYLGTIPLVKKSANTNFFASIGIPIMLLDEWSDLHKINSQDLTPSIGSFSEHPALYIEYWLKLIHNKRI